MTMTQNFEKYDAETIDYYFMACDECRVATDHYASSEDAASIAKALGYQIDADGVIYCRDCAELERQRQEEESETKPDYPRGNALLVTTINHIIAHPETWNQERWHCDTSHCFFGWAQILAGRPETAQPFDEVRKLLKINEGDAEWLSAPDRTLPELYEYVKNRITPPELIPLELPEGK